MGVLRRLWAHRHDGCSIYSPCRRADLNASWEAFKRRVDDPATRDAAIAAEWLRMREGLPPAVPRRHHA